VRVAIIKSNYTPYGGGEKYTLKVIEAFRERGINVTLLAARGGGFRGIPFKGDGFRLVELSRIPYNNLLKLLSFNSSVTAFLNREKFDIVLGMDRTERQTHVRAGGGSHAAWIKRRSAYESPLKRLSFRINPFHLAMIDMERKAFTSPGLRKIITNSCLVKDEIAGSYGVPERKMAVVHNGVEWDELGNAFEEGLLKKEVLFSELGLEKDRHYYIFVGSGYARKGLGQAIRAMGRLPEYTSLLVIGKDKNEDEYKRLAQELGLAGRVRFFGPQKKETVNKFLQAADAFVLPTVYDPFSNATLEALAMGLYVVTTPSNGCSEVLGPGAGSIIPDILDIESVADAMQKALGTHAEKREIRDSVRHLAFKRQLGKFMDECLAGLN
jgi:UDP-glucose:(heptosyl)LPS alpha-1,3-glucosyltransferase